MEDPPASVDTRARRNFGGAVKDLTVVSQMSIHPKNKEAIPVEVFHRLSLSVNDEPENLMIVPPLDKSMRDKITILQCGDGASALSADRAKNQGMVKKELPALLWQLERLPIPAERAKSDPRTGCSSFHDPVLLELLCNTENHTRLGELIDEVVFAKPEAGTFRGTADALEKRLRESAFEFALDKLLYFSSAAGTYLGRLKVTSPERYEARKVNGKTIWTIKPPKSWGAL